MRKYIVETHLHTMETSGCAKVPAADIPALYKKKGYDVLVVTDHYAPYYFYKREEKTWEECVDDYLQGYRILKNKAEEIAITAVLGMELTFESNFADYLVYGITEQFLYENPRLYRLNVKEFSKVARANKLYFSQAHPFRQNMDRVDMDCLDGLEAINANPRSESNNAVALRFAKKNNLIMTSGSDFHQLVDLATGGIVVDKEITSSHELADYLLDRSNHVELMGGAG